MSDFEYTNKKYAYDVRAMDDTEDGNIIAWRVTAEGHPEEVMPVLAQKVGEAYVMRYGVMPENIYISPVPYHPAVDEEEEFTWLEDQSEYLDGPEV